MLRNQKIFLMCYAIIFRIPSLKTMERYGKIAKENENRSSRECKKDTQRCHYGGLIYNGKL